MAPVQRFLPHGWLKQRGSTTIEHGYTLVEMLIAATIALVVLGLVMVSLPLMVNITDNNLALHNANEKVYLAVDQLERQVEAANVIFNPATEGENAGPTISSGFSLRLYSSSTGTDRCDQWRVTATMQLEDRFWTPGIPSTLTSWVTVATGIENSSSTPPFALAATSAYGDRMLNVHLVLRASQTTASTTTNYQTSFTATDAQFYSPAEDDSFCTVPSA